MDVFVRNHVRIAAMFRFVIGLESAWLAL